MLGFLVSFFSVMVYSRYPRASVLLSLMCLCPCLLDSPLTTHSCWAFLFLFFSVMVYSRYPCASVLLSLMCLCPCLLDLPLTTHPESSNWLCKSYIIRGVRGHRQQTRKNSVKLGKNAKNRLQIKEKAEILA